MANRAADFRHAFDKTFAQPRHDVALPTGRDHGRPFGPQPRQIFGMHASLPAEIGRVGGREA